MSEEVEIVYPALFIRNGVHARLWRRTGEGKVSVQKLRALFKMFAVDPDGATYASAGMMLAVQQTHCLLSPAMYGLAVEFAGKAGLLSQFKQFAPEPVASPETARSMLQKQPDWQAVLIRGLMLDGLHGYPAARGWMRAAAGHMLKGNVTILEILARYLRDCDQAGVRYFIGDDGGDEPSAVTNELRGLFERLPAEELEYDILRVLSARAPEDFLARGRYLSGKTRMLRHLYDECISNPGALWATPEQMRLLVGASWLTELQRNRLQRVWADRLK